MKKKRREERKSFQKAEDVVRNALVCVNPFDGAIPRRGAGPVLVRVRSWSRDQLASIC